jgi:hypothetical protein
LPGKREARGVETLKGELEALTARKGELTGQALAGFLSRMDEALPEGNAYVRIAEKGVAIGDYLAGVERPLQVLSGGERVAFDVALTHALGACIYQGPIVPDVAAGRIK